MIGSAGHAEADGPVIRMVRAVSNLMLVAGGLLILAATSMILVEIVARQVFRVSLGGVDHLAGFALAIASTWSFAATLMDKRHIRIDTVYQWLGEPVRRVLDVLGLAALILFLALWLPHAFNVFKSSLQFGTTTQTPMATPLAYPQGLWVAGLAWFAVVATILLAASLRALLLGRYALVGHLAGSTSLDEEIADELASEDGAEGLR